MRIWRLTGVGSALLLALACSTSAQQSKQMAPGEVVLRIGSTPVTLGEVDARALQEPVDSFGHARLVQALYLARRGAIDSIIADRLLDGEAKSRGLDRAAFEAREITAKVTAPTDADVELWYQTNPDRVQGRPLDQLRTPIRSLLVNERTIEQREALLTVLRAKTPVVVLLEPPRQEVAIAGHATRGSSSAPIELVEFSDFQCPFCQRANPVVEQVLKTYGDRIRFVYRHYPLPNHPNARPAAEAAACALEQGKFWPYHDRLFANGTALSDADLKSHAAAVGLDTGAFNACVDGRQKKSEVDKDIREAEEVGVTGTPAFFINGRSLEGAQPFEAFKEIIDEELAAKK